MKRNYIYVVAACFLLFIAFALVSTHALDVPKKPASAPKKVERSLPKLPHIHGK